MGGRNDGTDGDANGGTAERRGTTLRAGDLVCAVRRLDARGFEVAYDLAARLPGHVDLHEGGRLTRRALIVAEGRRGDAMRYAFKQVSDARAAPPLDYAPA